jgi:HEAT repeat protein
MSKSSGRLLDLMTALGSESTEVRVQALIDVQNSGPTVLPDLLAILERNDASLITLVWTMLAIGQFGPAVADQAHSGLVNCLAAVSPTVRRAAIRALGQLRDSHAIDHIAALTSDDTLDPSAWFDDDCTVAQAAVATLADLRQPRG